MSVPVHVLTGDDPVLLGEALSGLVGELLGGRDPDGVVDTFAGDEYQPAEPMIAAASMSMFDERIVIMRNAARFKIAELGPLFDYLSDPNPTTVLVVVWERPIGAGLTKQPFAKKVSDAVKAAGGVVTATAAPTMGKQQGAWIHQRLAAASVRLTPSAEAAVVSNLGEDMSRVVGLIDLLDSSFAPGSRLEIADVEPFLSSAGGVPPWDLTDAIAAGDVAKAVVTARRMMIGGSRHPLQLMATLQTHFEGILALDGLDVRTEAHAAEVLGMKPYPAKKLLTASRSLGSDGARRAVHLLARADVDVRGVTALDPAAVMEVLVGRLANLSRRR